MALKLFRSTGYSTLLMPGEARLAMHPGWLVLATSLWLGLACNVALWRELSGSAMGTGLATALLGGAVDDEFGHGNDPSKRGFPARGRRPNGT